MRQHSHYFKEVNHLQSVDVYRVLKLFNVTDPATQHAVKKLLCAGNRGIKDHRKDLQEAMESIQRALEMLGEDEAVSRHAVLNRSPSEAIED